MKGLIADQTQRVPREAGSSWDGKIRRVLQAPNESGGHVQQYLLQNKQPRAAGISWTRVLSGGSTEAPHLSVRGQAVTSFRR